MTLETEAYEGELKKLRMVYEIFDHTVLAEKFGDRYFICGEVGGKDKNNLPDKLLICPAYGVDWFAMYKKTDQTAGPEW